MPNPGMYRGSRGASSLPPPRVSALLSFASLRLCRGAGEADQRDATRWRRDRDPCVRKEEQRRRAAAFLAVPLKIRANETHRNDRGEIQGD